MIVGVAAAVGVILYWRQSVSLPPASAVVDQESDIDEPAAKASGYVGAQACAPCHAARVAEFQATSHFLACRPAQASTMPAGFAPGKGKHATHDPALRFEMSREGDDFIQTAIHSTARGQQRSRTRIDLVYGAAGADEVFFSWRDDRLYELPVVWLHPLGCWGNSSYNPYGTGDFAREATPRCLECHNTWMAHVAGTPNQYRRDNIILGVTCERCHGPGREHVAFHQANPRAGIGEAIVQPARLPRDRQLEVCTQCHSNAIMPRGPAFSYRPGKPLDDFFRTLVSKHPENDHVANQVQYLRQSKCFQKSDLTCTTCHNPHRPARTSSTSHEGEVVRESASGRSCLKCHKPAECADHERLPVAVRGQCVECHMPQRVWMNVHFHTEDDQYVPPIRRYQHRIAVYPRVRQEVLLAWYRTQPDDHSRQEAARLKGQLVKQWLAEAERCRDQHRFLAAIGCVREALRLDPDPVIRDQLRRAVAIQAKLDADLVKALHEIDVKEFNRAAKTLKGILAVKPDHAVAHGKLGTVYAVAGQGALAVKHLEEVARCDPDNPYGYMMLGWLAYLKNNGAAAVAAYRHADDIEPFNAKTNYHWGLALAQVGRWADAGDRFKKVLTIDPKHAGACQGLSRSLRQQGQTAEAVRYAERAARLCRYQNADILLTLAEAYADAGRTADVNATLDKALQAAQAGTLDAIGQIRVRVEEIRARATSPLPAK